MIAVIIAGGSGTRLWPLSTPDYPKHLLKITNDKTLLQNTFHRASLVANDIYVISEDSHSSHVYTQLPDLPKNKIIIEPARRGTGSCVVAALAIIKKNHDENEPVVFMHADHHIRDNQNFIETVTSAAKLSSEYQRIVLLGLEPTYAATGFGYIERGKNANGGRLVYDVSSFKEKPDHITANKYLSSGRYLWNMGYFVAPINVFEHNLKNHAPHLWAKYQDLLSAKDNEEFVKHYLTFENEPIDTALIEHVKDLLVIPGNFDWMDVGSYQDVHQVTPKDEQDNAIKGKVEVESVTSSLVRNDTDVPVAVIGLDNVAVVVTDRGILVTSKGSAQKVGEISKKF